MLLRGQACFPWAMLVGCMLANRTQGKQFRPVLWRLLDRWPTPGELAAADEEELGTMLRPLGLWRRRATSLKRMSADYASGARPPELHGTGEYALASWTIFVKNTIPPARDVRDGKLKPYVTWRRRHGEEKSG